MLLGKIYFFLIVIKVWWFSQQSFCGDLEMFEADWLSVFSGIYMFIQLTKWYGLHEIVDM